MNARRRAAHILAVPLAGPVARYIRAQGNRLVKDAAALAPGTKDELRPYFGGDLLEDVGVVVSESLQFPAIPFETALRKCGVYIPSAELIAAMTFGNLVAMREAPSARLLFHELVHVAQFRQLGVGAFARLYVRGFLAEGSYDRIPLERCASLLEERFVQGDAPFSVEAAVASWYERGLF